MAGASNHDTKLGKGKSAMITIKKSGTDDSNAGSESSPVSSSATDNSPGSRTRQPSRSRHRSARGNARAPLSPDALLQVSAWLDNRSVPLPDKYDLPSGQSIED